MRYLEQYFRQSAMKLSSVQVHGVYMLDLQSLLVTSAIVVNAEQLQIAPLRATALEHIQITTAPEMVQIMTALEQIQGTTVLEQIQMMTVLEQIQIDRDLGSHYFDGKCFVREIHHHTLVPFLP